MRDFPGEHDERYTDRRALPRVFPVAKLWAAVDNETRDDMLGMAEVSDFSGLGLKLRGMPGDPVAAIGDSLWVTLIAEEGIIPLRAKIIYVNREGVLGVRISVPEEAGQYFLLRLYERAAAPAHNQTRATD